MTYRKMDKQKPNFKSFCNMANKKGTVALYNLMREGDGQNQACIFTQEKFL